MSTLPFDLDELCILAQSSYAKWNNSKDEEELLKLYAYCSAMLDIIEEEADENGIELGEER